MNACAVTRSFPGQLLALAGAASFVGACLPGCYGSPGQEPPPVTDSCGDIKRAAFPIINGTDGPDPAVVDLTGSQMSSIGCIISDVYTYESYCTGTLIAPNVVMTAAHCISEANISIQFNVGRDVYPSHREAFFSGVEWYIHPMYPGYVSEYDIALLVVVGDPIAEGLVPIPVNCDPTSLLGETVQAVGYGLTDPAGDTNTIRYWTTLPVTLETEGMYQLEGEGTGVCFGDSGGPLLYTKGDGEVNVMGVASGIERDSNCSGYSLFPRTDFSCDFINAHIAYLPCWGETAAGRCSDDRVVRCEGGSIVVEKCRDSGMVCEQEEGGQARCASPPDPCTGETFAGRCDGTRAIWCAGEILITRTCAAGELCGDAGDGLNRCVEECALIGLAGRCDGTGSTARWCEDGVLKVRDCGACGQVCGWVDDTVGYYCR